MNLLMRRRMMMQQAQGSGTQPIYRIENIACEGDFYHEIPELSTGDTGTLYTDDWAIAADFTPSKLYTDLWGAGDGIRLYVNWNGITLYNSYNFTVSNPWNQRHKIVVTHASADADHMYGHGIKDGVYGITDARGTAIKNNSNYVLAVGWNGQHVGNRQFYGTIHELTVWHGYIPTEAEIRAFIGIL